jgi:pimeloyl-ACP methyl ester carboxylesterase
VVLVHGLGMSSRYWTPLGRRLAALGREVLAPDLPGFGRSKRPAGGKWPAGPDPQEQAEQLRAWLDARGIARPVLVGNSAGAQTVAHFAARYADRAERVVLISPTPDPAARSPWRELVRILRDTVFEPPSLSLLIPVEWASAGLARVLAQQRRTVRDPVERQFPRVFCPALVIRGRFDAVEKRGWAEQVAGLLPQGRLVVIGNGAHDVHYAFPGLTATLVDSFLRDELTADPASLAGIDADAGEPDSAPLSPAIHTVVDYLAAAGLLAAVRLTKDARARNLLAVAGTTTGLLAAATDGPLAALHLLPPPVHRSVETAAGLQALRGAARLMRPNRVAALTLTAAGLLNVLNANLTRVPPGRVRLI